jgi:hypothetical protein
MTRPLFCTVQTHVRLAHVRILEASFQWLCHAHTEIHDPGTVIVLTSGDFEGITVHCLLGMSSLHLSQGLLAEAVVYNADALDID